MTRIVPLIISSALALCSAEDPNNIFGDGCPPGGAGCDRHAELPHEIAVRSPPAPPPTSAIVSCSVNSQGEFGSMEGQSVDVGYFYEVETEPDVTIDEMNNDILNEIEREISRLLLTLALPECGEPADRRRQRYLASTGGHSLPPDRVINEASCQLLMEDQNDECFVVYGKLEMFVEVGLQNGDVIDEVRTIIKKAMDEGLFDDNVHPDIVKVEYLDVENVESIESREVSESQETNTSSKGNDSGTDLSWLWAMLACIGVLIIAWLILRRVRRVTQQKQAARTEAAAASAGEAPSSTAVETPTNSAGAENGESKTSGETLESSTSKANGEP